MGSREKTLIVLLGLFVYGFLFYQFNYLKSIPEINTKRDKIVKFENDLVKLKQDQENMESMKTTLRSLQARDDRLSYYLKRNFYITDSIYFMEKFRKIFNKDLDKTTVEPVRRIEENGLVYY